MFARSVAIVLNQSFVAAKRYSPDSTARSSRNRISASLLVSAITKRTRPWLVVSA